VTERGLPHADSAPACPFVAFEDDRDERASVPDHRHRCYADQRPAPRALAHQEAYCLSSAFPVCPTFQDWARREAARSRDAAPSAPSASAGMNRAATGAAESMPDQGTAEPIAAGSAGLAGDGARVADASRAWSGDVVGDDPSVGTDRPGRETDGRHGDDLVRRNPPRDWAAPPPWLASAERRDDGGEPPPFLERRSSEPGQGLAGSPADRLAGGPPPARRDDDGSWSTDSRSAAALAAGAGAGTASGAAPAGAGRRPSPPIDDDRDEGGEISEGGEERRPARRPRAYAQHLGGPDGPDWERPRRYEAYPTIRSRVGLPAVPRILGLFGLVVVLALALFLLPGILNLGGKAGGPGASSGASQAPQPSASLAPTEPPAPTPVLYTIKKGDTLSKVAKAHGITIEELMAANPAIKNPDRISEGQQITIPAPSAAPPDTIGGSAAP
jgi:nucleoid-associated protein YgaU